MLVVNGDRQHQPIQRQHPGVIGHHQRRTFGRQVLDTADFDPEPRPEEEPQQRPNDRAVEVRIEPELVDGVITRQPLPEEPGDRGDALSKIVERCLGCRRRTRDAPMLIDFPDDSGDLFGRCAAARIGE